ncbi:MAG: hypothetical protein DRN20_02730 [Thermoplasmata archaeon]|nr:MAG: hypothetical protein DRN20_02730 [Thermoplasmata archaeon]
MRLARALRIYREEDVYSALSKHIGLTKQGIMLVEKCVKSLREGNVRDIEEGAKSIFSIKKEADSLMRSEVKKLSASRFSPENRADLLELMLAAEKIIDEVETVAYTMRMIVGSNVSLGEISADVKDGTLRMAERIEEEISLLERALLILADDPVQAVEICNKAADIENIVDELYFDTMVKLMIEGKEYNPVRFFLMRELILGIEEIADRGEDLADRIRIIIAERT